MRRENRDGVLAYDEAWNIRPSSEITAVFPVPVIFSFWSFEISEDILRNKELIVGQAMLNIFGPI